MFAGITMTAAGWSVISLIMLIFHAIRSVKKSKSTPAVATIKNLKEKIEDKSYFEAPPKIVSTTYLYDVDVLCNGQTYATELKEVIDEEGPTQYSIGQEITIQFYPKKAKIAKKSAVNKTTKWAKRLRIGVAICILSELLAFLAKKILLG